MLCQRCCIWVRDFGSHESLWNAMFFFKVEHLHNKCKLQNHTPFWERCLPIHSFLTSCNSSCLLYRKHSCFTTVFIDSSYLQSFFSSNEHQSKLSHTMLLVNPKKHRLPTTTCFLYHTYVSNSCVIFHIPPPFMTSPRNVPGGELGLTNVQGERFRQTILNGCGGIIHHLGSRHPKQCYLLTM